MRVAALDCGTNSTRLLIADSDAQGGLVEIDRRLELTRLGQGVDATGRFADDALARTLAAIGEYGEQIRRFNVDVVRFVATSAARDASNRDAFFSGVRERLGVEAEIISGDEEAQLSFEGAKAGVPDAADPVLVIDVGGGSTELVNGADGTIVRAISLNMGSVRLRERFLRGNPPTVDEIAAASAFVDDMLDGSGIDFAGVSTWIGVAGTVTTLSGAHQRLAEYDRTKVHRSLLSRNDLATLSQQLLSWTVDQTMVECPSIPLKRAEVICAGSLICARIAERVGVDHMVVSESDILDGVALELIRRHKR